MTPWWVRVCRPLRERELRRPQQIAAIDFPQADVLRDFVRQGHGVLITPNHSTHYDSTCLYSATERAGVLCHFLTAWQVFGMASRWQQWSYQRHGCFSIDRENTDVRAFKQAAEILQSSPYPLVIFPEGDIHHVSDRLMPFREGAAAIALSAAKKSPRPITALPCAIKFRYVDDPTPSLQHVVTRLEARLLMRPHPEWELAQRVLRVAEVALTIKEVEHAGQAGQGTLTERLGRLAETILTKTAQSLGVEPPAGMIPERVKELRKKAIQQIEQPETSSQDRQRRAADLDDLFLVVQLHSYPGNYLAEAPTPERLAETVDKLEEDVLGASLPTVHGRRRVEIRLGEPLPIERESGGRGQTRELTALLERRVQGLLDTLNGGPTTCSN